MNASHRPLIDFVTVVFSAELPLLLLQARSIRKFVDPSLLGKIILIINDHNEADLVAPLKEITKEYGPLAERVEIVYPDDIFRWDTGPSGLMAWLNAAYTRNRAAIPIERQTGWRRHRGWQLQQALKLASVRCALSEFLVILDAKNHFLSPIGIPDFVSDAGKPLTYYEKIGDWQLRWFRDACKVIGIDPASVSEQEFMPSMTPFVVRASFLAEVLETVEAKAGPVQVFFGTKRDELTEFALIFAHCIKLHGDIHGEFELGLTPAAFTVRDGDPAHNRAVISHVEAGESKVFGLHRLSLRTMTEGHRARIAALWAKHGLISDTAEAAPLMDQIERAA